MTAPEKTELSSLSMKDDEALQLLYLNCHSALALLMRAHLRSLPNHNPGIVMYCMAHVLGQSASYGTFHQQKEHMDALLANISEGFKNGPGNSKEENSQSRN